MHPVQALEWIFPADSESGHLAETKKDREILSKWGNALRQTFRTIATIGMQVNGAKSGFAGSLSTLPARSTPNG
jgi:hypothetical protein